MHTKASVISIVLLSLPGAAVSQGVTGDVHGRVLSSTGEPLALVQVETMGPTLQSARLTSTNSQGYYRVSGLAVGSYTVHVRYVGFQPVRYDNVDVRLGGTTDL